MSKKYKPLEKWNGILKGEHPIFILGNGPSLTDNDLSLLVFVIECITTFYYGDKI